MTGKAGSILIVDDNKSILTALKLLLGNYFNRVVTLPAPTALVSTLRSEKFDVVLLDMNFSAGINNGNEGLYWLSEVKKESPAFYSLCRHRSGRQGDQKGGGRFRCEALG